MAINETVKAVADIVSKEISFDGEARQIKVNDTAYEKALETINEKEGTKVTTSDTKAVFGALSLFSAGSGLATGELAINEMSKKKNSDIEALSAKFPVAKQVSITHNVSRKFDATPIRGKDGADPETLIKYGRLDTKLEVRSIKPNSNAVHKEVRDYLYEIAERKLSD